MTQSLSEWLEQITGLDPIVQGKILTSAFALLLLVLLNRALLSLIQSRIEDVRARYTWQKVIGYLFLGIGIIWGADIWLNGFRNIATYLGLLSAGLAIALRDLILNFVGWVYILVTRPLAVGDRVQVGATVGDVIDLRIFQFTVLEVGNWVDADQSTGRVIHIPNGKIFSDLVANYHSGFQYIWNELTVMVTVDSDWQKAREILQKIAAQHGDYLSDAAQERVKEATRKFMIQYANLTPTVYTTVKDRGIALTIRYLCEPRLRRTSADAMWMDILKELGHYDTIHLAHT